MSKLQLPTVTIMCIDCLNTNRAIRVLEHCKSLCDFGCVKFLTSLPTDYQHAVQIMPLNTLIEYSIFMLTKCVDYIKTDHVLIVQRDGWILNTSAWDEKWLSYDYIAPLFIQYDHVGSGGFSLRSKRLMMEVTKQTPKWNGTPAHALKIQNIVGYYEDGVICFTGLNKKFRFATREDAAKFAQGGNRNREYYYDYPFGFHGAFQNINHETGFVPPTCEHIEGGCTCALEHLKYMKTFEE